jgi:hypothetical protein
VSNLFFAQPKKSNQKKGCPEPFFYIEMPNRFLTHHLRHYVPVLAEARENIDVSLAKAVVHFNKNGRGIRSRISLV